MGLHPFKNDKGIPVIIKTPHSATTLDSWQYSDRVATVVPGGPMPDALGMIPIKCWDRAPSDRGTWVERVEDTTLDEPPFDPKAMAPAAGAVVVEGDGRIWLIAPTNEFGGYKATFPKGRVTPGLSLQQSAVKEAFEEAGLHVMITAHLIDVLRSGTYARYYLAHRVGGNPAQMGWESQAVHLVPQCQLGSFLNSPYDKPVLDALRAFPGRKQWSEFVKDWHGTARRVCFTIQGFAVVHGRWPTRLLIDPETLNQVQAQLTLAGFHRLLQRVSPELQLRHTLAVADEEDRMLDYNHEAPSIHPASLSTDATTTWLWEVVRPNPFT